MRSTRYSTCVSSTPGRGRATPVSDCFPTALLRSIGACRGILRACSTSSARPPSSRPTRSSARCARRPPSCSCAGCEGHRRGSRRPGDLHAPLRIAGAPAARSGRRTRCRMGLRRADATRASRRSLPPWSSGRGSASGGLFPRLQRSLRVRRSAARAASQEPGVVFVGALERYKNVDGLADAWRLVAPEVPAPADRHRRGSRADR